MSDRRTIDDGYPRIELGVGQEPFVELLPGARRVGSFNVPGEQLRRVRLREATVVIVRNRIEPWASSFPNDIERIRNYVAWSVGRS